MKITDLAANTDLLPLWEDEGDHGVYMRPMNQKLAKRLRAIGRSSSRLDDLASAAERAADDAEFDCELEDDAELREAAEAQRKRATELRGKAEQGNREFLAVLCSEVVVDGRGEPLEMAGDDDLDEISPTLIVRLWSRVQEVHAEMGKPARRSKPTAKRGSGRGASIQTTSA